MANMENLKEMASDAAQTAAKAARYVALVSKDRLAILTEKEKIRRNYTKLGRVYYKDYVTDEEPDSAEYEPLCAEITESFRRINALREEIAAAKAEHAAAAPDDAEVFEDVEGFEDAEEVEEAEETQEAEAAAEETAEPEEAVESEETES